MKAADTDGVRQFVEACRVRAWLAGTMRDASYAIAASCLAAALLVVVIGPEGPLLRLLQGPPLRTLVWFVVAGIVLVAASAATARWRRPSAVTMATTIDRRLGLPDSVSAALQVTGTGAAVEPLVVRSAALRIRGARPDTIVALPWRRAALIPVAAAFLVASAVASDRGVTRTARNAVTGSGMMAAAGSPEEVPETPTSETAARIDGGTRSPSPANPRGAGTADAADGVPSSVDVASSQSPPVSQESQSSPGAEAGGSGSATNYDVTDTAARSSVGGAGGARGLASDSSARSADGAPPAGAGGSTAAGNGRSGAGGVGDGQLITDRPELLAQALASRGGALAAPGRPAPSAGPDVDASVPPDLRDYVRAYLRAVRSATHAEPRR